MTHAERAAAELSAAREADHARRLQIAHAKFDAELQRGALTASDRTSRVKEIMHASDIFAIAAEQVSFSAICRAQPACSRSACSLFSLFLFFSSLLVRHRRSKHKHASALMRTHASTIAMHTTKQHSNQLAAGQQQPAESVIICQSAMQNAMQNLSECYADSDIIIGRFCQNLSECHAESQGLSRFRQSQPVSLHRVCMILCRMLHRLCRKLCIILHSLCRILCRILCRACESA